MFKTRRSKSWGRATVQLLIVASVLISALLGLASATSANDDSLYEANQWEIERFHSEIVLTDGEEIDVTETIEANFFVEKHGIFRSIPYKYDGGRGDLKIKVISVVDESGAPRRYTTSTVGDYLEIKIGDPDVVISGRQAYVINYTVGNAIDFYDEHDELFWNATGNEWPVAIREATATVTAPPSLPQNLYQEITSRCFTGGYGSKDENCTISQDGNKTSFRTDVNDLGYAHQPYDGLTVVVGYPKGYIEEPTLFEKYWFLVLVNIGICCPFIFLPIALLIWSKHGRDPRGKGTVVPQYDPPDGLLPAEVGVVYDNTAHPHDITATVIDLAIRGYIKIEEVPKKLLSAQDYIFHLMKSDYSELKNFEVKILEGLFGLSASSGAQINLSSLKDKFYSTTQEVNELLYSKLTADGYYTRKPKTLVYSMGAVGIAIIIGSIFLLSFLAEFGGFLTFCGVLISGVCFLAIAPWMSQRTPKGRETEEYIKGLKMYIEIAEKDRISTLQGPQSDYLIDRNAPKRDIKLFEKLLPYAMVLKVEKQWAGKFADIYKEPPSWYSGSSVNTFNTLYLVNSLSAATSAMGTTFTSSPRSSGSGFSGGGFSGGGGGGGGGGSW